MKIGDRVRIINAENIECNYGYFKNGDEAEITSYKGLLALKHKAKELGGGLVIFEEEQKFLEIL